MGVGIYYFYHGFGLKAFEGRHIRISIREYKGKSKMDIKLDKQLGENYLVGINRLS